MGMPQGTWIQRTKHDGGNMNNVSKLSNDAATPSATIASRAFGACTERHPRGFMKDLIDTTIVLRAAF